MLCPRALDPRIFILEAALVAAATTVGRSADVASVARRLPGLKLAIALVPQE